MELPQTKHRYPFGEYQMGTYISSGEFGTVYNCQNLITKRRYAAKVLEIRRYFDPNDFRYICQEIVNDGMLNSPFIVRLCDIVFDCSGEHIALIHELCQGGSLRQLIDTHGAFGEEYARLFFFDVMQGVKCCHDHEIAHRDIKLDNVLLNHQKFAKLTDFGLSKVQTRGTLLSTSCGTLVYAAPEILSGGQYNGLKADIWSSGIMLYAMVFGHFPWKSDAEDEDLQNQEVAAQILSSSVQFPDVEISEELAELFSCIFMEEASRFNVDDVLDHEWFDEIRDTRGEPSTPEVLEELAVNAKEVVERLAEYRKKALAKPVKQFPWLHGKLK